MLIEFKVSRNDSGQRAERYLRRRLAALSLDRLHALFRRKEIKLDRKPIKRNHPLQEGDLVQVYGLRPEDVASEAPGAPSDADRDRDGTPSGPGGAESAGQSGTDGPFKRRLLGIPILHEDEDLLVLDKPAGLAVHPGTGIREGDSVIEKARAYLSDARKWNELFQPSLVHRLDKDTSGVLVIAKSGEALRKLNEALRDGGFHKQYLALVEGAPNPRSGEISGLLQRVDSRSGGAKAEARKRMENGRLRAIRR